jgi:hypothetical protein
MTYTSSPASAGVLAEYVNEHSDLYLEYWVEVLTNMQCIVTSMTEATEEEK